MHTPGPWKYDAKACRIISTTAFESWSEDNDAPMRVVDLTGAMGENSEANTALIAAAPEMLEALRALYEHCAMIHNRWGEGCNQAEADAAIAAGRAAVAKAEGR